MIHMPDPRPLFTLGAYTVLAERHEVLFRDSTTIGLHQVEHGGVVSKYLRCIVHQEVHALIVDVRDLAGNLAAELPTAQDRDVQGLVCFSLRLRFAGVAQFMPAAMCLLRAAGVIKGEPRQQQLFDFSQYVPAGAAA